MSPSGTIVRERFVGPCSVVPLPVARSLRTRPTVKEPANAVA